MSSAGGGGPAPDPGAGASPPPHPAHPARPASDGARYHPAMTDVLSLRRAGGGIVLVAFRGDW